jgi:hypothetical protein
MEASDMLDVIHYFFEEDNSFISQEHAIITERRRIRLYKAMYEKDYAYAVIEKPEPTKSEDGIELKPYIEPTEFNPDSMNPFGDVLDAPIG